MYIKLGYSLIYFYRFGASYVGVRKSFFKLKKSCYVGVEKPVKGRKDSFLKPVRGRRDVLVKPVWGRTKIFWPFSWKKSL